MGNCFTKQQNVAEITPADHFSGHRKPPLSPDINLPEHLKPSLTPEKTLTDHIKTPMSPEKNLSNRRKPPMSPEMTLKGRRKTPPSPEVTLCGDPENPTTYYLRYLLLYKPLSLRFFPSQMPLSLFTLRFEDETPVSGSAETVLHYIETKLPSPPLLMNEDEDDDETTPFVVKMTELQHRSMTWHVESVVKWGLDLAARGGKTAVDPSVGTPKMEVAKFRKRYGKVVEVLLEHAQMEERIIFPILHAADRGVCKTANEEHGRDLPIMNGIKEDIKSIGVLDAGTSHHREALRSLSARLSTLQVNCRKHFEEEEKNVFPLMQALEQTRWQQRKVVEQCIDVMKGTHSHLFHFFMEGLLPHEAMGYLELIMSCLDKDKAISILGVLVDLKG